MSIRHLGAYLPPPFFNRERELANLEAAWTTPGAQLLTLWGRRRVGKSTLLSQFLAGKRAVYLYETRVAERPLWVLASRSGFDRALRRRAANGELLLLAPTDLF